MNTKKLPDSALIRLCAVIRSTTVTEIRPKHVLLGRVKRKRAFEHVQNAQIQISLRMRKV